MFASRQESVYFPSARAGDTVHHFAVLLSFFSVLAHRVTYDTRAEAVPLSYFQVGGRTRLVL